MPKILSSKIRHAGKDTTKVISHDEQPKNKSNIRVTQRSGKIIRQSAADNKPLLDRLAKR